MDDRIIDLHRIIDETFHGVGVIRDPDEMECAYRWWSERPEQFYICTREYVYIVSLISLTDCADRNRAGEPDEFVEFGTSPTHTILVRRKDILACANIITKIASEDLLGS